MKIPNEDFTDETLRQLMILLEMILEVVMGVVYTEVGKVTDMVVNMEVADMLVKIKNLLIHIQKLLI